MTSARDLSARLADLLRREHAALAEFLVALADFDGRELWKELGHTSLFYFLHRELGLSKGAAFYRKTAAELIQKFPEVVEPLRDGRLCLTSIVELSKVLKPENREEVLPRFFQLSKQEAKAVSSELNPANAAPHRDVVTSVRVPAAAPALVVASKDRHPHCDEGAVHPDEPVDAEPGRTGRMGETSRRREAVGADAHAAPSPSPEAPPPRPPLSEPHPALSPPRSAPTCTIEPLTAEKNRLHVTVSRRFLQKLEVARAVLSHSHPGAGAQEILEAGLDLLIERHAKRNGLVKKPRREPRPAKPDYVPAHVRRAVWKRDKGRCQWRLAGGGICGSTYQVELDHVVPKGQGGLPTIDGMRLLCRVHNQYSARQVYGDAWMDRFRRGRNKPVRGDARPPSEVGPKGGGADRARSPP